MALSKDQIKFIEKQRSKGFTWKEVSDEYNNTFGLEMTKDTLRLQYNYYAGDEPDYDNIEELKKQRRSQIAANEARKKLKKALDKQITNDDLLSAIQESVKKYVNKVKLPKKKVSKKGIPTTEEILVGDIQLGKVMDDYNSDICVRRMEEVSRAAIFRINQKIQAGYKPERIIIPILGDLYENSLKHFDSMRGTDRSNPDQMWLVTEALYKKLILPIACEFSNVNIDVFCITGNHSNDRGGLSAVYPGKEHGSWTLYKFLELVCEQAGLKNVSFTIPVGAFATTEIYGHTVLYEHGVGVAVSEKSCASKVTDRSNQIGKYITYFRCGDKHNVSRFNNDRYVFNGAFFGDDKRGVEYSGIAGYNSQPGQIMFSYVQRDKNDPRFPLYDSFTIQLGHIK